MRRRRLCCALLLALADCTGLPDDPGDAPAYVPDRRDYRAFRARHPDVLEPNYLPFMAHSLRPGRGGDAVLVLCRWPDAAMPLPVFVHTPSLPEALLNEFDPERPEDYVEAVARALAVWEGQLEGLVRFRHVERPSQAALELVLLAAEAPEPEPDRKGLGRVRLATACRARGWAQPGERVDVDFEVPVLLLYLADEAGLLEPEQVEWIALHEIGHALGMRRHSPIPADIMYAMARDRLQVQEGLSIEDVNSFVSLYAVPNGTLFAALPEGGGASRPPPPLPEGAPELALAPHVDPRLGFSLRPPQGWMRVETAQGMVAVDGTTWDYGASFQVVVHRYATIEAYLQRYATYYLSRGWVLYSAFIVVNGHRALQVDLRHHEGRLAETFIFIESGDGRVFVVIADCPVGAEPAYRPWFQAALGSLEIWDAPLR